MVTNKTNSPRPFRRYQNHILIYLNMEDWPVDVPLPENIDIFKTGQNGHEAHWPTWTIILEPERTIEQLFGWFVVPMSVEETYHWYLAEMEKWGWIEDEHLLDLPKQATLQYQQPEHSLKTTISIYHNIYANQTSSRIRQVRIEPWSYEIIEPVLPPARTVAESVAESAKSKSFQKISESQFVYQNEDGVTRHVYPLTIPTLTAYPQDLILPSPHFTCFLASDARSVADKVIYDLAALLLREGLAYLTVWGPGCMRVHDIFDQASIQREVDDDVYYPVVMTTWHPDETLVEALDFLLELGEPEAAYQPTCQSVLLISVGNPEWTLQMREYLTRKISR